MTDNRSFFIKIENDMDNAINKADFLVMDVQGLGLRIQNLQTDYTKNEQRVESATDAALKAKIKANNANTELYQLNNDYKNVSGSLEEKTRTIGGAKDLAIDLQKRANDLAGQASNKLNYLSGTRFLPKIGFTNATSRFFTLL